MKKLLFTVLAIGSLATAQAQKGSILVYGNVGITSLNDGNDNHFSTWNVNPGVGFQVSNNFTIGIAGGYFVDSAFKFKGVSDKDVQSHFNAGIFARYSSNTIANIFSIYTQLDAGYMSGHEAVGGTEVKGTKWTGFMVGITPAVSVNVCHGFALNFSFGGLSFMSQKYDVTGATSASTINFNFGKQMNIGVSKNFGGHKAHGHHEPGDESRKIDTSDDDATPKKKPAKKDDDE